MDLSASHNQNVNSFMNNGFTSHTMNQSGKPFTQDSPVKNEYNTPLTPVMLNQKKKNGL